MILLNGTLRGVRICWNRRIIWLATEQVIFMNSEYCVARNFMLLKKPRCSAVTTFRRNGANGKTFSNKKKIIFCFLWESVSPEAQTHVTPRCQWLHLCRISFSWKERRKYEEGVLGHSEPPRSAAIFFHTDIIFFPGDPEPGSPGMAGCRACIRLSMGWVRARASNEPSWWFHNHWKGTYKGWKRLLALSHLRHF